MENISQTYHSQNVIQMGKLWVNILENNLLQ